MNGQSVEDKAHFGGVALTPLTTFPPLQVGDKSLPCSISSVGKGRSRLGEKLSQNEALTCIFFSVTEEGGGDKIPLQYPLPTVASSLQIMFILLQGGVGLPGSP